MILVSQNCRLIRLPEYRERRRRHQMRRYNTGGDRNLASTSRGYSDQRRGPRAGLGKISSALVTVVLGRQKC